VIKRLAVGVLLVASLLSIPVLAACGGDLPEGAVAQVGTALVSQDQFDKLEALYVATGKAPDKDDQQGEYREFEKGLAQYLVTLEVLRQEALAYKVTVTEQDVQAELAQIKEMFQGDEDKFEQALEQQNMTLEQLTQSIRERLLFEEMKAEVTKGIVVTEEEAKAYYEAHEGDYMHQESRKARHILIAPVQPAESGTPTSVPTQTDWEAAQAEADKVRSEILNGADFASEAGKYSDDVATRDSGGELGSIVRGQMVPAFEEAVFSLKKGELSEPIKTQYGYHLIEVTDITPEQQLTFDEVKEGIKSALLEQRQTDTWTAWLATKQTELGVVYRGGLEPSSGTQLSAGEGTTSTVAE